ncbi:MAG: ribonuclease HII [Nitrosopumilus sp. B06]|nr:MAG: ribonuclease HII [Nitrosopumilus sp. B06]
MRVCGIDEAGRGSMVGPLVVAGVVSDESKLDTIIKMGVKDSKLLDAESRERLYGEIIKTLEYHVEVIPPDQVDGAVIWHDLNKLEATHMAIIAKKLGAETTHVDSCDVNEERFGKTISEMSGGLKINSKHHADALYPVVSAASIVAKVTRDREVAKLGISGSGYPSDESSVEYLRNYYSKHKQMPSFARKKWDPVMRIVTSFCQQTLD